MPCAVRARARTRSPVNAKGAVIVWMTAPGESWQAGQPSSAAEDASAKSNADGDEPGASHGSMMPAYGRAVKLIFVFRR